MGTNCNHNISSVLCETASLMREGKLTAIKRRKGCRYHNKDSEVFYFNQLTPDGLCMHAFHSAYSTCLSAIYADTRNNFEKFVMCPDVEKSIKFKIIIMKHLDIKFRVINRIKHFLALLGIPCDCQLKRVFIMVVGGLGRCPLGHKEKDMFEFNLGNKKEICPASFETLYPIIYSTDKKEQICVNCPSDSVSINYYL